MAKLHKQCLECGNPFTADRSVSEFCSRTCGKKFHNRRMVRGAELYDWVMASRFERKRYPGALNVVSQIARDFRDTDKTERAGRKSWGNIERSAR